MNVIFVEPSFPQNQREFVRALHAAGAKSSASANVRLNTWTTR